MTTKLRIPVIIFLILLALAAFYTFNVTKSFEPKVQKPVEDELFDEEEAELGLIELDADENSTNQSQNTQTMEQLFNSDQTASTNVPEIRIPAPPKEMKYESGVNYEIKIPASTASNVK